MTSVKNKHNRYITNKVKSKHALKNLFCTALSSICYFRNLFEESAFKAVVMDGLTIHVLRENSKGTTAATVLKWIREGVKNMFTFLINIIHHTFNKIWDAINKGFLKKVVCFLFFNN